MRRAWHAGGALVVAAVAIGGGCALIVGIPDRSPRFCQTVDAGALLCDDFVDPTLDGPWHVHNAGVGTVALDDTVSTPSPGQSVRIEVPDGNTVQMTSGPYLQWDQVGSTAYGNIHLELDFYLDRVPPTENIWLLELVVSQQHTVLITVDPGTGRADLQEHIPPGTMTIDHRFDGNQDATIKDQSWTHVAIDLALVSGGTSSAEVAIDGVVQTASNGRSLAASWAPGTLSLQVGYPYMYSPAPRRTYFDNVVLYAQ